MASVFDISVAAEQQNKGSRPPCRTIKQTERSVACA